MPIDRSLIKQIRALDEFDLRRLQIFIRGLLVDDEAGRPAAGPAAITYRREMVRCGKAACRSCPHGPYWYAYWREDGRVRSRYIGRRLPDQGPPAPSHTS